MIARQILAIVAPTLARSVRRWIFHLGGLGFIPLGLLDDSVIPPPGSMDVLTIVLSARKTTYRGRSRKAKFRVCGLQRTI